MGPFHVPGPFIGDTQFSYVVQAPYGTRDAATVFVRVHPVGESATPPEVPANEGFAQDDAITVGVMRSSLVVWDDNDAITRADGARIVEIEGQPVAPGDSVDTAAGRVSVTARGMLNFASPKGLQMEPIWLPAPETVVARVGEIAANGYQNFTLWEHLGWSLYRVIAGFLLGALVGIPLGYAMGLSDWFRGWFDPIVEFMRPVPPLALIPLVIIWAGGIGYGIDILMRIAEKWLVPWKGRV